MKAQELFDLAKAIQETADALKELGTQHPEVFNSLQIRPLLADELAVLTASLTKQAHACITKEEYQWMQRELEELGMEIAQGHDAPATDARIVELTRKMDLSPWALDHDSGCIPKEHVALAEAVKLDCYVEVAGEASDEEDEGVQGFYLVKLMLSRPISKVDDQTKDMYQADRTAIAQAVLDEFHSKQGISCLDDFNITVILPNGEAIEENGEPRTGLVISAIYYEQIPESNLPFDPAGYRPVADTEAVQPHM